MSDAGARLADLSADERALLFEKLRRRKEQEAVSGWDMDRQPIPRRPDRDAPAPLSFVQQRLWFLDRLSPGEPGYNIGATVVVEGPLDEISLDRAVQAVVDRHESLRTIFAAPAGSPVQIVVPRLEIPIAVTDLSAAGAPDHPEVVRACRQMIELPFDLATGPLLRVLLVSLGPRRHVLALAIHHIVSDGWSMNLLVDDLVSFMRGAELSPLPVQYADYAVWQRDRLRGERLDRLAAVWRRCLGDLPEALSLPTDRPRPPVRSTAGAALSFVLAADTGTRLQAAAREEGVTPFMLLLAVYEILLSRWSGQEAFAVGSVVANRNRRELERLIGFFANTLVLRADLRGAPTVRDLLARIRETTLEAFAHQDVPFEKLVEELRPARDPSRSPIFQVSLSLQNTPPPKEHLGDLGLATLEIPPRHVKFDLAAAFDHGETGELRGKLAYSTALFDAATAERLAGHFRTLLDALLDGRELKVADLPLLTAGELRQLAAWNQTRVPGPQVPPEERFAALAAEAPNAPALVSDAGTVTRGKLDIAASRLARRLRRLGVGPEVPVGVLLPRSPELALAILAVARSGCAYLPLDPVCPAERIEFMLRDAGVGVLITRPGAALPAFVGAVIELEGKDLKDSKDPKDSKDEEHPVALSSDRSLAYVVYTSGSTGVPKGVAVGWDSLANLIAWNLRALPVVSGDHAMLTAGPAFDASIWELWLFLSGGAAIHVPDEETRLSPARLASWMIRERITVSFVPTPLAEALLAEPAAAELPLRYLLTGGDRLHRIPRHLPFPVANCYGPSEATVVTSASLDAAGEPGDRDPSVGRPIDNAEVRVLDAELRLLPVGVPGELWVGGEILGRGYAGRPDGTADSWRPDPFSTTPGARLYRTRDLARRLPDGTIEVLGRLDGQVKVRGVRIETAEVESVLAGHPAVRQAAVLPRGGEDGRSLIAALVIDEAARGIEDGELRGHLRRRLPEYMLPALIIRLPALPLTPGGKVDRKALERQIGQILPAVPAAAGLPPQSVTERALAALWAELLGRPVPGVDESFFDLGGHSLLLTRLQTRIGEELGRDVPLLKLIEHPTIASLAVWLDQGLDMERKGAIQPAPGDSRDRALRQRRALELQRRRLAPRISPRISV